MDSDSFKFYSVIKFFIDCTLVLLILFSLIVCLLAGGLWLKVLFVGGTFNILYLLSCVISRLIAGWLIKVKDNNLILGGKI